jgi:hypothetical protein
MMKKLGIAALMFFSTSACASTTPLDDLLNVGHSTYGKYIQLCSLAKETHRVSTGKHGTTVCKSMAKHHGKISKVGHVNDDVKNLSRQYKVVLKSFGIN